MSYEKVNGYAITPYDMDGVLCYAIRNGTIGGLIRNQSRQPLIFATKDVAVEIAKSIPKCSQITNFTVELY